LWLPFLAALAKNTDGLGFRKDAVKFSEIGLHPQVLAGVEANKFVDCTPVQEASIPVILSGRDLAGLAQTGTGKTAAFVLPLVDRIVRSRENPQDENTEKPIFKAWRPTNFILVLVPTRELAEQVYENVVKLGANAGIKATAIYGGTGYESQKAALKSGIDFIVATPGRLIDLYKEHQLDLGQVRAIVFDEADRMFDMGFKDDMKYILRRVPQERQFLVFSATLNFDVLNTAYEFGANPIEVNVSRDQAKAENVVDEIFHVGHYDKPKFLLSILQRNKPKQAIIFSNFKHNVDRITQFLSANGVPAMGISSLISQNQRTRIMELFRAENNDRNILVATDVAARGLDIKGVDMVINYELPDDAENYVHRIGRTGRAGANGLAFSLVGDRDVEALQRIENYLTHKVPIAWIDDKDLVTDFKPFPREEHRGPRSHSSGGGHSGGGSGSRNRPPQRNDRPPQRNDRPPQRDYQRPQQQGSQAQRPRHDQQKPHGGHQQRPHSQQNGQQRYQGQNHKSGGHTGGGQGGKPHHPREGYRHRPQQAQQGAANKGRFDKNKNRTSASTVANKNKGSGVAAAVTGFFKNLRRKNNLINFQP
jgi:superfamily II DNA/RNA helicase